MDVQTLVLVGLLMVGHVSGASWFNFHDENNPSHIIDANPESLSAIARCQQLAAWGQCAFYDCIEAKFPCGDNGYTNKIAKHFCSKIDDNFNTFDTFGRRWLNQTSVCLMQYMLDIYNSEQTSCQDIKNAGIQSILHCNDAIVDGKDFCEFLDTNGDAYNALMGIEEVQLMMSLRDTRVVRSMITDAVSCGVGSLAQKARSATEYLSGLFNRFTSYFWN